jgi:ABC-2 type transport system ATP-binding protein
MIVAEDLFVRYSRRSKWALKGVSLAVPEGSLFGLVGPNGSGKTTFLRLCSTLLGPTRGRVTVGGFDIRHRYKEVLQLVGYVPDTLGFYPDVTAREHIRFWSSFYQGGEIDESERTERVLSRVGLEQASDTPVSQFSAGMKRRLAIGQALVAQPTVLLLDEPFNALDLQGTRFLRDLLRASHEEGVTTVISSHILSELDNLCTEIAIFDNGSHLGTESVEKMRAEAHLETSPEIRIEVEDADEDFESELTKLSFVTAVARSGSIVVVKLAQGGENFDKLLVYLTASGKHVRSIRPQTTLLEEAVLGKLREGSAGGA